MAQDRVLGEQLDLIDVTGDIAADTTAIGIIATGLADDPTAATNLAAGLDHTAIGAGIGTNTHIEIDTHIADGTIHFSTIDGLSDVNAPTPSDSDVLVWQNGSSTWILGIRVENPMVSDLDVDTFSIVTASNTAAQNTESITLQGGDNSHSGGGFASGDINLTGGVGTNLNAGGNINLNAGESNSSIGGIVVITAGNSTFGAGGQGGHVLLFGGSGTSGTKGGNVDLFGGNSTAALGGNVNIFGGESGVTTGTGGGVVNIKGGENKNLSASQPGGDVNIEGGATTTSGGQSGSVNIRPGGDTGNTEGSINLYAATANSSEASINLWSESGNAGYVALKAPALVGSPAINRTWVLPQDDPASSVGLFLTTDASGVLSFTSPKYIPLTIASDISTSRALILADAGQMITMTNAAPNTIVIPLNATVAFAIGTEIVISQFGAGQTSFIGEGSPSTVTINSAAALTSLAEQFSTATIVKTGTDTWLLTGDIV